MSSTLEKSPAERPERLSAAPPAVVIEHLSKTFRLPQQRYSTFKERALHPVKSRRVDELRALRDINLTVGQGEFFGIVGRNGSGKSTLLKCLAGIYEADQGSAHITGLLSPFIELGVGFNPELSARDNVLINAIMLGLTRRQARERFDDIIAFAELEDFLDLKLKNYSSGMSVRLAFSVAIQVDAEILLIDEVLAVGDAAFQQKCYDEFHRLKNEGKTIVLVTHDMSAVERFCDRAMLIERGRVVSIDEPHRIARAYNELNFGRITPAQAADDAGAEERYGAREAAEIKDAWFENAAGERVTALTQEEPLAMCMEIAFHATVENPIFTFHLRNEARHTIFATASNLHREETGVFAPGTSLIARVNVQNWLAPGRYDFTPMVARQGGGADALDLREDLATVVVHGVTYTGGIVDIPHTFGLEQR